MHVAGWHPCVSGIVAGSGVWRVARRHGGQPIILPMLFRTSLSSEKKKVFLLLCPIQLLWQALMAVAS